MSHIPKNLTVRRDLVIWSSKMKYYNWLPLTSSWFLFISKSFLFLCYFLVGLMNIMSAFVDDIQHCLAFLAAQGFEHGLHLFLENTTKIKRFKLWQYVTGSYGVFTLPDTETETETEIDPDTDKCIQNPIWICFDVCLYVVWTPPHNSIQPILSISASVSVSGSVNTPLAV